MDITNNKPMAVEQSKLRDSKTSQVSKQNQNPTDEFEKKLDQVGNSEKQPVKEKQVGDQGEKAETNSVSTQNGAKLVQSNEQAEVSEGKGVISNLNSEEGDTSQEFKQKSPSNSILTDLTGVQFMQQRLSQQNGQNAVLNSKSSQELTESLPGKSSIDQLAQNAGNSSLIPETISKENIPGMTQDQIGSTGELGKGAAVAGLKLEGKNSKVDSLTQAAQNLSDLQNQDMRNLRGDAAQGVAQGKWMASNLGALQSLAQNSEISQAEELNLSSDGQSIDSFNGVDILSINAGSASSLTGNPRAEKNSLNTALSGSEFLNTLNSVRTTPNLTAQANQNGMVTDSNNPIGMAKLSGNQAKGDIFSGLGKGKKAGFEDVLGNAQNVNYSQPAVVGTTANALPEITGHVVQGSMAQDRLSNESLTQVSAGIRNLSLQGGGEIRIRLKPEELGQLDIRVITDGNRVGIQIQASDEKAKKIIEGSLTSLKDGLNAQNLMLGQVDLTVMNTFSSQNQKDPNQDSRHSQGNFSFQDGLNQNSNQSQNQGQARQWSGSESDAGSRISMGRRSGDSRVASNRSNASQVQSKYGSNRIDVRA